MQLLFKQKDVYLLLIITEKDAFYDCEYLKLIYHFGGIHTIYNPLIPVCCSSDNTNFDITKEYYIIEQDFNFELKQWNAISIFLKTRKLTTLLNAIELTKLIELIDYLGFDDQEEIKHYCISFILEKQCEPIHLIGAKDFKISLPTIEELIDNPFYINLFEKCKEELEIDTLYTKWNHFSDIISFLPNSKFFLKVLNSEFDFLIKYKEKVILAGSTLVYKLLFNYSPIYELFVVGKTEIERYTTFIEIKKELLENFEIIDSIDKNDILTFTFKNVNKLFNEEEITIKLIYTEYHNSLLLVNDFKIDLQQIWYDGFNIHGSFKGYFSWYFKKATTKYEFLKEYEGYYNIILSGNGIFLLKDLIDYSSNFIVPKRNTLLIPTYKFIEKNYRNYRHYRQVTLLNEKMKKDKIIGSLFGFCHFGIRNRKGIGFKDIEEKEILLQFYDKNIKNIFEIVKKDIFSLFIESNIKHSIRLSFEERSFSLGVKEKSLFYQEWLENGFTLKKKDMLKIVFLILNFLLQKIQLLLMIII